MDARTLERKVKTTGIWFVGTFMREFIHGYPEYSKCVKKRVEYIKWFYEEYAKNLYSFASTQTKCYAMMEIINSGKVVEALEYVFLANDKKIDNPDEVFDDANNLLNDIISGRVILPESVPKREKE